MEAVILAGGFGSRLSEYTELIPKPMVRIGDKPILSHIMDWYRKFLVNDFIIATGYKSECITSYFFDQLNSRDRLFDFSSGRTTSLSNEISTLSVKTIYSGLETMTGGRLFSVRDHVDGDIFLCTYGDGVSNVPIDDLVRFHKRHGKIATITAVRPMARFGVLEIDNARVCSFKEKQAIETGWINGGYFVFTKKIFDYLDNYDTVLEKEPLESLARDGQLMVYQHNGFWQCMDTKRDRDRLCELWEAGAAPWA